MKNGRKQKEILTVIIVKKKKKLMRIRTVMVMKKLTVRVIKRRKYKRKVSWEKYYDIIVTPVLVTGYVKRKSAICTR